MGQGTKIEWADATFSPWIGCQKVSPACDNCYAEAWAVRYEAEPRWGAQAARRRTAPASWAAPRTWQRQADRFEAQNGRARTVFCASLADVFDNQVPDAWRADLWSLIADCDRLIWLLLTKRPQNIKRMLPPDWGEGWPHVWLGTTAENQAEADRRVPALCRVPAAGRFLSCEPLLERVELTPWLDPSGACCGMDGALCEGCPYQRAVLNEGHGGGGSVLVDWVIAGGETGRPARPTPLAAMTALRDQCVAAGVPFFFKQWGRWQPVGPGDHRLTADGRGALPMLDGRQWTQRPAAWQRQATGTLI